MHIARTAHVLGAVCVWLSAALVSGCYESHPREIPEAPAATLEEALAEAPRRLEVSVRPETGIAAEVRVLPSAALRDEERLSSGVAGLRSLRVDAECQGRLTTPYTSELRFDGASTTFYADGEAMECGDFVQAIQDALAEDRVPLVVAERPAPTEPAAPDDGIFRATEIELIEELDLDVLRMNADADNLVGCETLEDPPADCTRALRLLGTEIALTARDTQIAVPEPATPDTD